MGSLEYLHGQIAARLLLENGLTRRSVNLIGREGVPKVEEGEAAEVEEAIDKDVDHILRDGVGQGDRG